MNTGIRNMLDLSTAHMPSEEPDFGGHRVTKHEYGFIVFVPGSDVLWDRGTPQWLHPCMKRAQEEGCILINFDRDAGIVDGLPCWEW